MYFKKIILILVLIFFSACVGIKTVSETERNLLQDGIEKSHQAKRLYNQGCYEESLRYFFISLEIFSSIDSFENVAASLSNIANTYQQSKKNNEAISYFNEAKKIYEKIDRREEIEQIKISLAEILIDSSDIKQAATRISDIEKTIVQGSKNEKLFIFVKAKYDFRVKKFESGKEKLSVLLKSQNISNSILIKANILMGEICLKETNFKEAKTYFEKALNLSKSQKRFSDIANCLYLLGESSKAENEIEKALFFYRRSLKAYALLQEKDISYEIIKILQNLGADTKFDEGLLKYWLEGKAVYEPCREY